MSQQPSIQLPETCCIPNMQAIYDQGIDLLAEPDSSSDLVVDCKALARFDSSVLALLLSWLQVCQACQREFSIHNWPAELTATAKTNGSYDLLESFIKSTTTKG